MRYLRYKSSISRLIFQPARLGSIAWGRVVIAVRRGCSHWRGFCFAVDVAYCMNRMNGMSRLESGVHAFTAIVARLTLVGFPKPHSGAVEQEEPSR
jgi:hypothetical protein